MKKHLSPKAAKSYSDILRLQLTVCAGRTSMLHLGHAGEIWIWNKRAAKNGGDGTVRITRKEFEKFQKFYTTGQDLTKGKRDNPRVTLNHMKRAKLYPRRFPVEPSLRERPFSSFVSYQRFADIGY